MKSTVFVITPFGADFLALFDELKATFYDQYEFTNAGDMDNQQSILKDIVTGISSADVIIADLTGNNPNVFYELGLAHAMNKKVIIITQDIDDLPFDIKSYRAFQYSMQFNKISELKEELKKNLDGAIDGTVAYGNPVYDFLPDYNPKRVSPDKLATHPREQNDDKDSSKFPVCSNQDASENDEDRGLLDFIGDINQSTEEMMNEINLMGEEISSMGESIGEASSGIERHSGKAGNHDISFIRKICRNVAIPINDMSNKITNHVEIIIQKWSIIENSYLLMLDNERFDVESNKEDIQKSMHTLHEMQKAIKESNDQINTFDMEMKMVSGYERTLTKAVTNLSTSLNKYVQATDTMASSIDRIISKIQTVIGE